TFSLLSHLHSLPVLLAHSSSLFPLHFLFFFYCSAPHRDLHSFPTRRSSDLQTFCLVARAITSVKLSVRPSWLQCRCSQRWHDARSEEHTSELLSPDHLVCRLLLEKKKKN